MQNKNNLKSHPLDNLVELDEQNFYKNIYPVNTNNTSNNLLINVNNNNNNNNNIKPKVPPKRRYLPKIPDNNNNRFIEKPINFYIEIENVKWFYKPDQDQTTTSNSSGSNTTNSPNIIIIDDSINDSNSTNKKWLYFNKLDSFNLEVEYRSLQTKRLFTNNIEPNLVQVLDGLYEVNLLTKKCNAIYWKAQSMIVMRSLWFTDNNLEPFDEKSSDEIEKKHNELFREQISKTTDTNNETNIQTMETNTTISSETDDSKTGKIERNIF
jgi:hypothetical protein